MVLEFKERKLYKEILFSMEIKLRKFVFITWMCKSEHYPRK